MKIIGVEEHLLTAEVKAAWLALDPQWQDASSGDQKKGDVSERLNDLGDQRIAAMDNTGIDVQVLSLTTPGVQNLTPDDAVALQVAANDLIAQTVRARPDRFQGLATLATPAPTQAAQELERAVTTLGLNGAMLCGRTRDRNLDHADFWPIFEAADALKAPLHLHPQTPVPGVRAAYYNGLGDEVDTAFATHGIGWHYETGMQFVRMVLAGVFDRFPDLQVILGHWGEVVLFYLDRIDELAAPAKLKRPLSDYVRSNAYVAPSGMLSQRYLRWAVEVVGVDRILFSVDYPFVPIPPNGARDFLQQAELSDADREKIASGNWDRLCANIRRSA